MYSRHIETTNHFKCDINFCYSETTNGDSERDDSEDLDFCNEKDVYNERLSDDILNIASGIQCMELFDVFSILFIFTTYHTLCAYSL